MSKRVHRARHFRCPVCRGIIVRDVGPSPVVSAAFLFDFIAHVIEQHGGVKR